MNSKQITARIAEYAVSTPNTGNDELSQLKTTLYIEDVFGIELSDIDICKKNLSTPNAINKLVSRKLLTDSICAESAE
jgi:acyl carrier protein